MDGVTIRKATPLDLETLLKLNLLLFKSDYLLDKSLNMKWTYGTEGKKYFKKKIADPQSCVLLAEHKGVCVGYLAGGLAEKVFYRIHNNPAELENMFVLIDHRSKGVGTKLTQFFLDWCRSRMVDYVLVNALYQNEKAIEFYEKNNFNKLDVILIKKVT